MTSPDPSTNPPIPPPEEPANADLNIIPAPIESFDPDGVLDASQLFKFQPVPEVIVPPTQDLEAKFVAAMLRRLPELAGQPADSGSAVIRYDVEVVFGNGEPSVRVSGRHDLASVLLPAARPEAADTLQNALQTSIVRPIILRFMTVLNTAVKTTALSETTADSSDIQLIG